MYHLLYLVKNPHYSLACTLDPCAMLRYSTTSCALSSSNLLDWALSWHLWRVLTAYGYRPPEGSDVASHVCQEFASQLEDAGLWEWAIFVLLHVENDNLRECFVKNVIARHVSLVPIRIYHGSNGKAFKSVLSGEMSIVPPLAFTKAERFVVNRLGVPSSWIHEAKVSIRLILLFFKKEMFTYNLLSI